MTVTLLSVPVPRLPSAREQTTGHPAAAQTSSSDVKCGPTETFAQEIGHADAALLEVFWVEFGQDGNPILLVAETLFHFY